MNQDQRKYLLEQVDKTFRKQAEKLEGTKPLRPSLNNYLVAAFLDGSVKFQSIEKLKAKMREAVLKFGANDRLVLNEDDDECRYRRRHSHENQHNYVQLSAFELFVIPAAYEEALKEYEEKRKAYEKSIEALEAQRDTIKMKIQIGSDKVLSRLIEQVDNMADLSIMNSQLLLIAEPEKKGAK